MTQKSAVLEEKECFDIPIAEGHPSPGMDIPVLIEELNLYQLQQTTNRLYLREWSTRITTLYGLM